MAETNALRLQAEIRANALVTQIVVQMLFNMREPGQIAQHCLYQRYQQIHLAGGTQHRLVRLIEIFEVFEQCVDAFG